jgi:hypothetical protein
VVLGSDVPVQVIKRLILDRDLMGLISAETGLNTILHFCDLNDAEVEENYKKNLFMI